MKTKSGLFAVLVIGLSNFFAVAAFAGLCDLSPSAQEFASAVHKFTDPKNASLWQSYPKGFQFGFADFDVNGSIFLIENNPSGLVNLRHEKCDKSEYLYRTQESLAMSLAKDDRVWFCGPDSLSCDILGSLSNTSKTLNVPVMIERIAKAQMEINFSTFPSLDRYFTQSDMASYLSAHEMFHIYQMNHFNEFRREHKGIATTSQCYTEVKSWANKLESERAFLLKYMSVGYQPSKTDALAFLSKLNIIRSVQTNDEKLCLEILEREERLEGTAHYIGNLFLEKYKSKKFGQLASVDRLFLIGEIGTVNWLHAYVSGNLVMRAIKTIDPTKSWEKDIEDGASPFSIARNLISREVE